MYIDAVAAASLTEGLTASSNVGYHFLLFGGSCENVPVKEVAFASVVLKRGIL